MLAFTFIQCTDNSSVNAPESPTSSNVEFNKKQKTAANLAKILAYELQKNDKVRQEVFAKIATQIDGDFEVPLDYLNPNTLGEIENTAKELKVSSSLKKTTSNFGTVEEIKISELENKFNAHQIAMPYAANWTDDKIKAEGGLIVAYYPFGVKDTEIKELVGYNKNGEKVIITEKTAPSIPYVILSENERKMILDKVSPSLKTEFKNYSGDVDVQWQNKKLNELKELVKDEITLPLIDNGGSGGSGGGGGYGGGTPPGRTDGSWEIMASMQVLDDQEPYWSKGNPEIRVEFKSVKAGTDEKFYYDDAFDGTWVLFSHRDNTGWIGLNQNVIQWFKNDYGPLLQVFVWEEDSGNPIKWEISVSYKDKSGLTVNTTLSVDLNGGDDKMGTRSINYAHSRNQIYGTGYWNMKMTY